MLTYSSVSLFDANDMGIEKIGMRLAIDIMKHTSITKAIMAIT